MAETDPILRPSAQRLLAKYRKELLKHADLASRDLAALMAKIERKMIAVIRRGGSGAVTREEINRIGATINRVILESHPELAGWLNAELPAGHLNGLATQAAFLKRAYDVESWDRLPIARIRDAFVNFEEAIRKRQILRVNVKDYAERWSKEWNEQWTATARALQHKFIESHARGTSWLELADEITDDLGELKIAGKMGADVFARGYARAKLTEAANDASIAVAHEASIDSFVNIGVSDAAQSEICRDASGQEPMSEEEWASSEWGKPPRHVLNCRCDLVGVPPEIEEEILNV